MRDENVGSLSADLLMEGGIEEEVEALALKEVLA